MAGKIAMEHMTPVMLLTDGFIANGSEPWKIPSMSDYPAIVPPIVERVEGEEFLPYARNEKLARGWAFPGKEGLEHRIGGLEKDRLRGTISHDPKNHQEMVTTRKRKVELVAEELPELEVFGANEADVLVVGWGGTRGHLHSAVKQLQDEGKSVAHLHFNYIYPLQKGVAETLKRYKRIVVCELNEGQFANYLRQQFTDVTIESFGKTEGQPFTVVELKEKVESML
jgi:2-oxoglutarate ferredoxin oxidoreductase subunit alpha